MMAAARNLALRSAHSILAARLRAERSLGARRGKGLRPRVLATACWSFPIYSQTFVYQELCELVRAGFDLRFLYSRLDGRTPLPPEYSLLSRLKRRLILDTFTAARDAEYYRQRMPMKVQTLTQTICQAAGLPEEQLIRHPHFLHAFSFTRVVEAWRPDYLHSYFFYERTLFALVASQLLGIPRGVSCYADHLLKDYELKLVPLHMRTCDLVLATSNRIRVELEEICGAGRLPNIVVKPNAIDTSRFPPAARPHHRQGEPHHLVCVSRIHPKKGLLYLVDALRILLERKFRVVLHLVGECDAQEDSSVLYDRRLRRRIGELGLGSSVRMEGRRSSQEVRRFLESCDVFVAPFVELENGDKDGIPTVLLEAMATGCPVVVTDAGSIREVIEDGVDGLVTPQRQAQPLADAVARLISDPALSARLSQRAAQEVRRRFDVGHCEAVFHRRVREIVDRRREFR